MVIGMLLVSMPAMAQWGNDEQITATAPSTTFQSTSGMSGSNSAYSSNPTIGADGTAAAPSARRIGVRRNDDDPFGGETIGGTTNPNEPGTPVGGVWPLLLLAAAYGANKLSRKGVK